MESFENLFLSQINSCKNNFKNALQDILENIFNIYDYDGDDNLNIDEYITFISDLLYVSVLMNRISESEYTTDNVKRIARWCSSNFKHNIFREPQEYIAHDIFLSGILYAVTENRDLPIFSENNVHIISFLPEIIHYFDYYEQIAKRRGWPTERAVQMSLVVSENTDGVNGETNPEKEGENGETTPEKEGENGETNPEKEGENGETNPEKEGENGETNPEKEGVRGDHGSPLDIIPPPIKEPALHSTSEQQINQYRERQKQKQQEKKDKEEHERLRIINEQHDREDAIQREIRGQQERLEHEQRERERVNLEEENRVRQRILQQQMMQQQLQQINTLQNQFRERLRKERNNRQVNQFDDQPAVIELEEAGHLHIDENTIGFDVIDGDIKVEEYINSNKADNVVFKMGDNYFLASKERIKSMIQQGEKDNSLFYGCMCEIEGPWNRPETWAMLEQVVIPSKVFFNIQQLGLPIRYVDLVEVEAVLNSSDNYFLIEKPDDFTVFPSFASDNVLNHGIGSMSGLHCNDGQMDIIYKIKKGKP